MLDLSPHLLGLPPPLAGRLPGPSRGEPRAVDAHADGRPRAARGPAGERPLGLRGGRGDRVPVRGGARDVHQDQRAGRPGPAYLQVRASGWRVCWGGFVGDGEW